MPDDFKGAATPLADTDLDAAAAELGCERAVIDAVCDVESSAGGFLDDGRPKICSRRMPFTLRPACRARGGGAGRLGAAPAGSRPGGQEAAGIAPRRRQQHRAGWRLRTADGSGCAPVSKRSRFGRRWRCWLADLGGAEELAVG